MGEVRDEVQLVELPIDFQDYAWEQNQLREALQIAEVVVEEDQTLHQELLGDHHQLDHVELSAQDQPLGAVHQKLFAEWSESPH